MRIATCDDNAVETALLGKLLDKYATTKDNIEYDLFTNVDKLLTAVSSKAYDVILLDVIMPGINGIEAAREIRSYNNAVEIVFLTSSPEYALESYSVRADDYLIKPVKKEMLFPVLDRLYGKIEKNDENIVLLSARNV
ncbi:MAG: response regulator, partial [Lachnospiraceae bacterium]|nr:response regulator [Lachnospiraceae bacterium]